VTALSDGSVYEYDANGNMTCRAEGGQVFVQTYNAENRMAGATLVSGTCDSWGDVLATWTFVYDGDGNRVKQVYTAGTSTLTTYYFGGGSYEVRDDGTTITTIKYYAFGGQTIAMAAPDPENPGTVILSYFLTDHLGSVVAITDASGVLLEQQRYLPFGQVRTLSGYETIGLTDYGYTGQRNNSYIKLLDYRSRWYDPLLGRFIQPDSIIPQPANPQAWNRYAYVYNRPINLNDPTGHNPCNKNQNSYECKKFRQKNGWEDDGHPPTPTNTQVPYDAIRAGRWANDNEGVFIATCKGYSCAEFVSTVLCIGGLDCSKPRWNPSQSCTDAGQPWNSASALYDYLTNDLGFKSIPVDMKNPEDFFQNTDIPPGSPVFYQTGFVDDLFTPETSFVHVAITTGDPAKGQGFNFNDGRDPNLFFGMAGPEVADHNGRIETPHLLYQVSSAVIGIRIVLIGTSR
jgi:RHS repeat-associated protein